MAISQPQSQCGRGLTTIVPAVRPGHKSCAAYLFTGMLFQCLLTSHPQAEVIYLTYRPSCCKPPCPWAPQQAYLTATRANFLGILSILNTKDPTGATAGTYCQDTPFLPAAKQAPGPSLADLIRQAVNGDDWDSTANTRKQREKVSQAALPKHLQCKEATAIVVLRHVSHRRRQLRWHCHHTQATEGDHCDCSGSTCKPYKEATATALPTHASSTRRQL